MKTTTEFRQSFEELIERAEFEIEENPTSYRWRLRLLALLGYGLIFGLLLILVALIGGSVWAALASSAFVVFMLKTKLFLMLFAMVWLIARSLFVSIKAPQGYELTRKNYPALWGEVDKLSKYLKTPTIHTIILTPEMNAAIAQTPRFGIVGPYKNTLILGLELLLTLSKEEAKSVLAHELAHLSGNHSKFSSWIYRVRESWRRINHALHENYAWGTGFVRRFIEWYQPYFAGYSYVLARDNEYEADALAAKLTSPEAAASALVSVYTYGSLTDEHFWEACYKKAYHQQQPENNVYTQLREFCINRENYQHEFDRCLRAGLKRKAHFLDTHPSLLNRLKALKSPGTRQTNQAESAIDWLGSNQEQVLDDFNQRWVQENSEQWQDFYQRAQSAKQKVADLHSQDYVELDTHEKWQLASLTERYLPDEDALPLFRNYQASYPKDLDTDLVIGRLLLERDNEEGLAHIEKAMKSPGIRHHAAQAAWQYYTRIDNVQKAEDWLLKWEMANDMLQAADAERESVTMKDEFIAPAALEPGDHEQEQALLGNLSEDSHVREIWIAQKKVKHFQEHPVFVIAIKSGGFMLNAEKWQDELLAEGLDSEQNVFVVTTANQKPLAKRVMRIGRQLY